MTTKLNLAPQTIKKEELPFLRENKANGFIVMFTGKRKGVVLFSGPVNLYHVGFYGETWTDYDDELVWEKLPEGTQIVLTA